MGKANANKEVKAAKSGAPTSALFKRTEPASAPTQAEDVDRSAARPARPARRPTTPKSARPLRSSSAPSSIDDPVVGISLALRQSEFDDLQRIADQHHASRGSLITVLARFAIRELKAGRVKLSAERQKFTQAEPA